MTNPASNIAVKSILVCALMSFFYHAPAKQTRKIGGVLNFLPSESSARMELPVDVPQPVAGDVRVNLRGGDVRVAEQFLDDAQIRAFPAGAWRNCAAACAA